MHLRLVVLSLEIVGNQPVVDVRQLLGAQRRGDAGVVGRVRFVADEMLCSLGEERRRVTAAPFDAYTVRSEQPSEFPYGLRRQRRFVGVQRGANRCLDSVPQILRRPVIETPVSEEQSRLRTKIHVRGSVYPRRAI